MFGKMKVESLKKLYLHELKDAYDFEHQITDALPKMIDAAHHDELKQGFREHLEQTKGQIRRLEQVFESLGEKPERKTCDGMKGIIDEGESMVKAKGDDDAVDAGLIAAAQRVEHYEMATYGTLRTYAGLLGYADQERLLQQTLDEEGRTDEKLTGMAKRINVEAMT